MKLIIALTLAAALVALWPARHCAPLQLAVDRLDGAAIYKDVCDPPRPWPI